MRRIRHRAQQPLVEDCKRSSRGYTDQFWFGGPMLALIVSNAKLSATESPTLFATVLLHGHQQGSADIRPGRTEQVTASGNSIRQVCQRQYSTR